MKPIYDASCSCINIDPASGLVRVDGIPVFKVLAVGNEIRIQFLDGSKLRSQFRGTQLVEVPLSTLVFMLEESIK